MTSHPIHRPAPGIALPTLRPGHLTVFTARETEAQRAGFAFSERDRPTDFVAHYPGLDALCVRLGLDASLTLAAGSRTPARVLLELARAAQPHIAPATHDLASASLDELVEHLLQHHHHPLRWEMNRLALLIQHLAEVHPHQRDIQALAGGFSLLRDSLLVHMLQEETDAFPLCRDLEARRHTNTAEPDLVEPLHQMAAGHTEMGDDLAFLARLIDRAGLSNDPDAVLVRSGLVTMGDNLRLHTAIENEILLPAAIFTWELMSRPHQPHTPQRQDPADG